MAPILASRLAALHRMRMARYRLITLGRLALVDEAGVEDPIGKRRRKLALLTLLALSKRPMTRDALVDLFWGEQPEERARHSLSDALSHLRSVLGRDAITSRQADIALDPDASLSVDMLDLVDAVAARDHRAIVALYAGPFLDGVFIPDSSRFESWVSRERARAERAFIDACATLARSAAAAQQWDDCESLSRRWLDVEPTSAEAALLLMQSCRAAGTPDALRRALGEYDALANRLGSELEMQPAADVTSLRDEIGAELSSIKPSVPSIEEKPTRRRRLNRRRAFAIASVATVVLILGVWEHARRDAVAAESARPVVAIIDLPGAAADTSIAWLRAGFAQLVAASLSRTPSIEIVPESRVHSLVERSGLSQNADADKELGAAARELGSRWTVGASLNRIDQAYVVQLDIRDSRDASRQHFTISGTNVIAVADEAAARVRNVADAAAPGPHLADIETSNVDAFEHFVRANQAGDEGRFTDQLRELDLAIAADSGFTSAIVARMRLARNQLDSATVARLSFAYNRASSRLTRWDALEQAQYLAFHNGEHARAEQLARELVDTYPHDPRAYQLLATTLSLHGKWAAADSVLERALRLDSLAIAAGNGPCAPCASYVGLIENELIVGDLASAERHARQWLALQPDLPGTWAELATTLAFAGRFDDALAAERHASQLAGDDPEYAMRAARILVMARRLDEADSLVRTWPSAPREFALGALDLEAIIARERGQYRLAERILKRMADDYHDFGLKLVHATTLAQLGRVDDARREFESMNVHGQLIEPTSPVQSLAGDRARSFAWHHALEADALGASAGTTLLVGLADSISRIGARSYFSRDWRLGDHVRGIVDLAEHRPKDAVRDLSAARFGVAGWTRTNALLADALVADGDANGAVRVLRDAYESPPDAMGRYLTRSELDYRMAKAFAAAGARDSARVYAGYTAAAWARGDAEIQARRRKMVALR